MNPGGPWPFAAIELTGLLGDVVYLAIVIAFFGLAVLFVRGCATIAGPEPADAVERGDQEPHDAAEVPVG
jgi:hypothetical protein